MTRAFTGWHMTAILVSFFGVVIAVNLTMATLATSTFGGVQVQNSYVASQHFNTWLEQAEEQDALGWDATTERLEDGRLRVTVSGPGPAAELVASARHPVGRHPDQQMAFDRAADGSFVSREALPAERWILRLQITDGADVWRREERL